MLSAEKIQLLLFVRKSIWNHNYEIENIIDWQEISKQAKEQGITNFIYAAAKSSGLDIPSDVKQSWKSQVLSGALHNERLLIAQNAVVNRFKAANIPVAVIKGSSIARYYPQPELRALGDIDLLINKNDMETAKEVLLQEGYKECDYEHDFHAGFKKSGVYLELHEQVTNFPETLGGCVAQKIASGFLDRLEVASLCGYEFPVLSRSNQAMSILLHMVRHLFEGGIGLRQLCDWMVFVASEVNHFTDDICPVLKQCGLLEFAEISTRTCEQYLGLEPLYCVWCSKVDYQICTLFMDAVFNGGNMGSAGSKAMGSLFTDEKNMGDNSSTLRSFFRKMNRITYKNFPFVEHVKILLPVFWVYLPIRYCARSLAGLRPKKSLSKVVNTAKKQNELFKNLHLFEINHK